MSRSPISPVSNRPCLAAYQSQTLTSVLPSPDCFAGLGIMALSWLYWYIWFRVLPKAKK